MKVYGQLEKAQLENLAANPTGWPGRVYFNTVSNEFRFYDGSIWTTLGSSSGVPTVTGTPASPTAIVAANGITPTGVYDQRIYIQGSGGAVDISHNPQIIAGTQIGQRLTLFGCSNTNTVLLENGTGVALNGDWTALNYLSLTLEWDGVVWREVCRT